MAIKKLKPRLVGRILKFCYYCAPSQFHFWNLNLPTKNWCCHGIPPGPLLAGHFMIHLGRILLPELGAFVKSWERYVDDTIIYIKRDFVTDIIKILNKIHEIIKFI